MAPDDTLWRERLHAILAEPAYHPQIRRPLFGGLLQAVWHWIAVHIFIFHVPHTSVPRVAGYVMLAVALGAALLFFRRLTFNPRVNRAAQSHADGSRPLAATQWLLLADELLRAGDEIEASRLLFRAALTHLAQEGHIRPGADRTNGEYVRALFQSHLSEAGKLQAIAADCDILWYSAPAADAAAMAQRIRDRVAALLVGGDPA